MKKKRGGVETWGLLGVFAILAALLLGVRHVSGQLELDLARERLATGGARLARSTERIVAEHLQAVEALGETWLRSDTRDEVRFHALAAEVVDQHPAFQTLNWVDADGVTRWVEPETTNAAMRGDELRKRPYIVPLLREAERSGQTVVSEPFELLQGVWGFAAYTPLRTADRSAGFLNAVFRFERLMSLSLGNEDPHLWILNSGDKGLSPPDPRDGTTETVTVGQQTFALTGMYPADIRPTMSLLADAQFLASLLLAALLTFAAHHALRRRDEAHETADELRVLMEHAPEALLVLDVDTGLFVRVNEAAERMYGHKRDVLYGLGPKDISPKRQPDGRLSADRTAELVRAALEGRTPTSHWTHTRADGELFLAEVQFVRLPSRERRLVRGSVTDITQRMEAERALRDSEERNRRIVETTDQGVWVLDAEGRTTFANRRAGKMLGVPESVLIGRGFFELVAETDRSRESEVLSPGARSPLDLDLIHANGHTITVVVSTSEIRDDTEGLPGLLVMASDLTEQRQLEEQLIRAQKMEAVGQLAGGIAHDFNNLLTGVLGGAELLALHLQGDSEGQHLVADIHRAGERATALTRQLLAFGRRQVQQLEALDIGHVARDMTPFMESLLGERVELVLDLGTEIGAVRADRNQLEQVILNLALNARDAMPDGGALTLSTRNERVLSADLPIHPEATTGDHIVLSIADEGEGIAPEHLPHIFEPFFTTKALGRGTGLGLATVHGTVTQSGGHLRVLDRPEGGTIIEVWLSCVTDATPAPPPDDRIPEPARGSGTVLIVEDDESVLHIAQLALASSGYQVLTANCTDDALALAASLDTPVDVLLTDVVMPDRSGSELAAIFRERWPHTRIVFMSGYTRERPGDSNTPFIHKPFTLRELTETVGRCLDIAPNRVVQSS